jgi:T4-like virus Myoviridae tail sheath stabiliser
LVRLQQDPSLANDVEILLPRLSFEILGMDYDSVRQLNKTNKTISQKHGNTVLQYSPVPYTLTFSLYSFTRTMEDNLQIIEQILPYFTPDMNLSIKVMQNPDVIQDCQLTLNSINTDDSYDGGFEERRHIITTFSFTLKINYFGPMFGIDDPENHFESGAPTTIIKKVVTNLNSNKYTVTVDPFSASETDAHNIIEGWGVREPNTDFDTNKTL